VLNVVDDFRRECVLQVTDFSLSGQRDANELSRLAEQRQLPKAIVCDIGPEFTCKAMFFWSKHTKVKLHFIQPGKPTQNAFVESFNCKFRDYYLNQHWFASLEDARSTIKDWREHYNHVRPHRSLNEIRRQCLQGRQPDMMNFPHYLWLELRCMVTVMEHYLMYIYYAHVHHCIQH
jgi:putative transposase